MIPLPPAGGAELSAAGAFFFAPRRHRSLARSSGIDFLLADIVDWGRKTDGSMDQLSHLMEAATMRCRTKQGGLRAQSS